MAEDRTPVGVVAVLLSAEGRPIASASDFTAGAPVGYTERQAQTMRAKRSLALSVMGKMASPILAAVIDVYEAERMLDRMRDSGCQLHVIHVGEEG